MIFSFDPMFNLCRFQMDRLFCYEFTDPQLRIAIEFLKSVFNRADVAYHLEENHVLKPVSQGVPPLLHVCPE